MKIRTIHVLLAALLAAGCSDSASVSLKLNEIQASNPDDDDWLELFNDSDAEVSLAGVQLRDTNSYWTFAGGTLAAGGFLKVTCDGKGKSGTTNFKLSSDGEQVTLLDADGALLDRVVFPALRSKTSWGRVPNGSGAWTVLGTPTPGKANVAGAPVDGGMTPDKTADNKDGGGAKPDKTADNKDSGGAKPDKTAMKADSITPQKDAGISTNDNGTNG